MDSISSSIDSITLDVVSQVQGDIDLYDIRSLVFLLYDVPYTALERLTLLQRVSKNNFDLLDDWAKQAQSRTTWKYEFLEALSICQLNDIIKKIGFDVKSVKAHFLPNNVHVNIYINPMKKVLYKLCENMTSNNFVKLKSALATYDIDVREFGSCELVLLELMCNKFIVLNGNLERDSNVQCQVENLTRIVENLPDMKQISFDLKESENRINNRTITCEDDDNEQSKTHEESSQTYEVPSKTALDQNPSKYYECGFEELAELCNMPDENLLHNKFKTDTSKLKKESYKIINKNKVGVCYIINQEKFYPSQRSIDMRCEKLEDRKGSTQDKKRLKKTMESFNFEVIVDDNLKYDEISRNIKTIIKNNISNTDSFFVLCILSHGIEGCIYTADSIPFKVRDIETLLDSEDAAVLFGKPKVLIIQACQAILEQPINLVSDGPILKHIGKTDFLVYWATVPQYLAYRDEKVGSVFIQILCLKIQELAEEEHLDDIFKKVNSSVIHFCEQKGCKQVPKIESTLRNKLFLRLPQ